MKDPKDMTNGELAWQLDRDNESGDWGGPHDELTEAAARLRATDWRGIESAPRDGAPIEGMNVDWCSEQRVFWKVDDLGAEGKAEYWQFSEILLSAIEPCADPTHWRPVTPLPPPPKT